MLYLVAQGPEPQQRWRRRLMSGRAVVVGRGDRGWKVEWDSQISREHAELILDQGRLRVKNLPDTTNPVFFRGKQLKEFILSPGDHFVIGQTRFLLVAENVHVTMDLPSPDAERNFKAEKLRRGNYRDAGQKIAVLSQLPNVISRASNEIDLQVQIVNILLSGIRRATTVGLVRNIASSDEAVAEVIHWDQRLMTGGDFQPSGKLIRRAVESSETVLHLWKTGGQFGDEHITVLRNGDWAFVSPLVGEAAAGMAIYVAGNYDMPIDSDPSSDPLDLHDDIKFTELVATTLANTYHVSSLKRKQASLRSFFSPVVLDAISTNQNPEKVLAPRECEVSVLFCDLRGFSMRSERYADQLLELLDRVSGALGVTTREILAQRGVVGDFHGDATMGFWGWPLDQPDRAWRACHAALEIQKDFSVFTSQPDHPLHDFLIGLGIATGNAVAGRIGTEDQVKVTVFGPVVNVAARLETMTQQLRAGILVDERTDELIRAGNAGSELENLRVRRLAVVQPVGMNNAIKVSQVLPVSGQSDSLEGSLSDADIALYESGLDEFTAGNWQAAFDIFHQVPATDQAKDFLTAYIAQHNRTAPPDWPGYISLQQK